MVQKTIIFILLVLSLESAGQVKTAGTPHIRNFAKTDYKAGTQNWGITQDQMKFMYFANNDGVLQFDGLHWNLIEVSDNSPVRSIFTSNQNIIYVGLFNDFGMLVKNQKGRFSYKSLRHLIPENITEFDDIWKIHETPYGIVFQAYDYLFILKENSVEAIKPHSRFHFSFAVGERLFVQEPGIGLFEYTDGKTKRVGWDSQLTGKEIWSIFPYKENGLLIGTARNGLYKFENGILEKWATPANELIENYKLFSSVSIGNNYFAYGTILNGVVITNTEGEIVQHINRDKGLQNNTVLSLFADQSQNLWLGLDNGIDYLEINSPVSFLLNNEGLGTGYTCRIFNNNLYVGTNQGLFVRSFDNFSYRNTEFELVENTTGQVWFLDEFDGQLICGHNVGTFAVEGTRATKITDVEGIWKFIRLKNHPDLLLGGHYNGLILLQKNDSGWQFLKKIKGFNESSRYLAQDEAGNIWMSHGAKGIFRITLNAEPDSVSEVKIYTAENGLPATMQNTLFQYNNKIFISSVTGIYEYRQADDSFIISEEMTELLKINSQLRTLEEDESGNIWFIAENESGVLRQNEDLTYTKIISPFKQLDERYVNGFEFIYPYSEKYVFWGIDQGFGLYSSEFTKSYSQPFPSHITKVEVPHIDSTLYLPGLENTDELTIPYKKNAFRFHYTAPFFEYGDRLEFSYLLENYTDNWSLWSENSFKDYTNLPAGEYVFKLKARNIYGIESGVSTFAFGISPPWYASAVAYYSYLALFLIFVFALMKFIVQRMEKARKKEQEKHMAELKTRVEEFHHQGLVAEKEIMKLKNEKLENEMVFRNKELANQTMSIIQKNQFLAKIKDELQRLRKKGDEEIQKNKLNTLLKKIDKEIDNKQQNHVFETYFDEVHNEFFTSLKSKYPQISPREMRLCAYIRMDLTSKEIAVLLNITERGVEIGRYRLRKKLELSRDTNLSTFLSNI